MFPFQFAVLIFKGFFFISLIPVAFNIFCVSFYPGHCLYYFHFFSCLSFTPLLFKFSFYICILVHCPYFSIFSFISLILFLKMLFLCLLLSHLLSLFFNGLSFCSAVALKMFFLCLLLPSSHPYCLILSCLSDLPCWLLHLLYMSLFQLTVPIF